MNKDKLLEIVDGHPRIWAGAMLILVIILIVYYLHNAGYLTSVTGKTKKKRGSKGKSIDGEELDSLINEIHNKQEAAGGETAAPAS